MLDVARMMAEIAGHPGRPLEVQFRKSDDAEYLVDNPSRRCPDLTKVRADLGYEPKVDLRTGLGPDFRVLPRNGAGMRSRGGHP